jgi:hypothetical protein
VARGGRGRRGAQDTANAMRNRMMARGCGGFLSGGHWCPRSPLAQWRRKHGGRGNEQRGREVAVRGAFTSASMVQPRRGTEFLRTVGHDTRSSF